MLFGNFIKREKVSSYQLKSKTNDLVVYLRLFEGTNSLGIAWTENI